MAGPVSAGTRRAARRRVAHVGRQVGVDATLLGLYDLAGRTAQRHRQEIRSVTGSRICSAADAAELTGWLIEHVTHTERREEQVRAELLTRCFATAVEPPTTDRVRLSATMRFFTARPEQRGRKASK